MIGRYATTQCATMQEPLVKFGIVPKPDSHHTCEPSSDFCVEIGALTLDYHSIGLGDTKNTPKLAIANLAMSQVFHTAI